MAHRHDIHKKRGGKVETHEAREHEEEKEAHMKRGGRAKEHKVHGHKAHHRLDKRARGGGVGSDKHPFSSAKLGK